ncbi:MAG: hypothetical protein SV775_05725, partial [Thermodesulfobacteriota bacterium]|nr:hypothetical protein [Thermodesulfobacteriota bacterium]
MCEYCDSIGGGELWYLKAENYSRQLYRRKRPGRKFVPDSVSGRKKRDQLLAELNDAFRKRDTLQIPTLKEEAEKAFTAAGVCQVLPLKDCYRIVEIATPVTSMHCVCRKMCRALEERHPDEYSCMGLGVGMLKWERWPERYRGGVNFFSPDDAKAWLKKWDKAGMVHMVMTYGTTTGGIPFIGGLCNCDYPDCLAIRLRADRELKHALLKAHYVAV